MLGEKHRAEPMFYHVRMADIIPENHLLRLVDRYVDLAFIRGKVITKRGGQVFTFDIADCRNKVKIQDLTPFSHFPMM